LERGRRSAELIQASVAWRVAVRCRGVLEFAFPATTRRRAWFRRLVQELLDTYRTIRRKSAAAVPRFGANVLFAADWYLATYREARVAVETGRFASGLDHYVAEGARLGYVPCPFFDEHWYLKRYRDVGWAIVLGPLASGFEHYLLFGAAEGRLPNALFQDSWYLAAYPDADKAIACGMFRTPFEHYCAVGAAVGNDPSPYFSEKFYLEGYPEVAGAVKTGLWPNGLAHYLHQRADGPQIHRANPFFDDEWYLSRNLDVAAAVAAGECRSALVHYAEHGAREGRLPSPEFDPGWYRASYPEVASAFARGVVDSEFAHFCWKGARLGRSPSARFDPVYCRERGQGEGRPTHPLSIGGSEAVQDDCARSWNATDVDAILGAELDFYVPGNEVVHFQRLMELAPDDDHARALLCYALLRHGRFDEARQHASVIDVEGAPFHGLMAVSARRMAEDHDGTKRVARKALLRAFRDKSPIFAFDGILPEKAVRGETIDLFLSGWAFHPLAERLALSVRVGSRVFPIQETGRLRPDVFLQYARLDYDGCALYSGFRHSVVADVDDIAPSDKRIEIELLARMSAHGEGERVFGFRVGDVEVVPPPGRASRRARMSRVQNGTGEIAICMATFNPDLELFRRQVDSIRGQTHKRWRLIISDDSTDDAKRTAIRAMLRSDPRVEVLPYEGRRGFYFNFERALAAVSGDVDYVALADQDDRWYPEKLESLVAALADGSGLAYADMRLVDRDGTILAEGFWNERENHSSDLVDLLIANTITGAASLFRRDILDVALPFPALRWMFHDQWLGLCAAALGRIAYVPRPLHDYVQHGANVIGSEGTNEPRRRADSFRRLYARVRAHAQTPDPPSSFAIRLAAHCTTQWGNDPLRLSHLLRVLHQRSRGRATDVAPDLAPLLDVGVVLQQRLPRLGPDADRRTLGMEWRLVTALLADSFSQSHRDATIRYFQEHAAQIDRARFVRDDCPAATAAVGTARDSADAPSNKFRPLRLDSRPDEPRRINFLIPEIRYAPFFGGYIGKFHVMRKLADLGYCVRAVCVDQTSSDVSEWLSIETAFDGLQGIFDRVEVSNAFDRTVPLRCSPADAFIATTWWTAHIAHAAVRKLGRERFLYLIQEYEASTFPTGSWHAMASHSYSLPHAALFSTPLLAEYFRDHRLGVFGDAPGMGEAMVFEEAFGPDVVNFLGRTLGRAENDSLGPQRRPI